MKVAVVGATGMVGQVMLKVLEERNLPITELIPVASERSVGNKVKFKDKEFTIVSMNDAIAVKPEIAIFLLAVEHLWSLLQNSPRLEQ
jgi:aspartate-semialdehyde dehydrogenase